MTSMLKVLGLALVAVFAMSAIAASAAQATPTLTSEVSPVTLTGTGGGYGSGEQFKAFGDPVECESSTFHTALTATPATEIVAEATYGPECRTAAQKLPVTVTPNGCTYRFYNLKFVAAGHYDATVEIKCPAEKVIEVHIYATHTTHTEKKSLCTLTVPPQTELEKATITTETLSGKNFGDLVLEGTIKIKQVIEHRNSILCPGTGGTPEAEGEEVIPGVTLEGRTSGGGVTTYDISGE